jgi:hypothetical protein
MAVDGLPLAVLAAIDVGDAQGGGWTGPPSMEKEKCS